MRRAIHWTVLCLPLALSGLSGCIHIHHRPPTAESCAPVCRAKAGPAAAEPAAASDAPGPPADGPVALKPTPPPTPARPAPGSRRELGRVRLMAVGDMIAHGDVLRSAAAAKRVDEKGRSLNHDGFDALFAGVARLLAPADLVFVNLETPIAPKGGAKTVPFSFNAPPALLQALAGIGVGLVSFANNHVYDQKRPGFVETLSNLEKSGLVFAGAGRTCAEAQKARLVTKNGIRLAFLAASTLYNQQMNRGPKKPCASVFDEERVRAEVAAARKAGAELVILSLHWGAEYHTAPRPADVELAHRLLDAGVDVLLGHHPHVLQPIEVYAAADGRICLVAYSLGNFISNQSRYYVYGLQSARMGNTRDGVALGVSVVKRDYGEGQVQVELADLTAEPLWTDNNALARKRDGKLPVEIRVRPTGEALRAVEARLRCPPRGRARLDLIKRRELYRDRRATAASVLGDDLVAPLPETAPAAGPCPKPPPAAAKGKEPPTARKGKQPPAAAKAKTKTKSKAKAPPASRQKPADGKATPGGAGGPSVD